MTSVTGVTGATDSPRLESYERWLGGHLSNRSTGRPTIRMDGKESRPLLKCGFEFSHSVCLRKEKRGCCCRARFYSNLAAATRAGFRLSRLALFCSPFLLLARGLPFQPRNPLFGMHCCLSSASRSITFSHIHPLSQSSIFPRSPLFASSPPSRLPFLFRSLSPFPYIPYIPLFFYIPNIDGYQSTLAAQSAQQPKQPIP